MDTRERAAALISRCTTLMVNYYRHECSKPDRIAMLAEFSRISDEAQALEIDLDSLGLVIARELLGRFEQEFAIRLRGEFADAFGLSSGYHPEAE